MGLDLISPSVRARAVLQREEPNHTSHSTSRDMPTVG
jgi:hypothetical protein